MASTDSLKIIAIAGRTDSTGAAAADQDQEETRLLAAASLAPGFLPNMLNQSANPNSFRVRQDTGANMNVKVGSGTTKVDGYVLQGTVAGQGSYVVRLDATTKTVSVPAADATNPARYGVYLFVNDTAYSGTAARAFVDVNCIRGTPAGSPTTPGPLAAWSAYVLLWEFQLPANATAVTNTILDAGTDDRVASAVPLPSLGPRTFTTAAKRTATIGSPIEGQQTVITGEDRLYTYDGSAWQRAGNYASAGRTGCHVGRLSTGQTIATGTLGTITFDQIPYDSDAFHSGATFTQVTIPAGLAGIYLCTVEVAWSGAPVADGAALVINGTDNALGGSSFSQLINTVSNMWSHTLELNAGDTIGLKLIHNAGSNRDALCRLRLWRTMI